MPDQEKQAVSSVQKGPMEGMVIVGGHPHMEAADMPTISFESILAIQRRLKDGPIGQER